MLLNNQHVLCLSQNHPEETVKKKEEDNLLFYLPTHSVTKSDLSNLNLNLKKDQIKNKTTRR